MNIVDNEEKKVFSEVYPFATEAVCNYLPKLDLYDKTVLTVGSSLDQAFNALLLGAKNVVVYDINANVEKFYKIKKELILNKSREEFISAVQEIKDVEFTSDCFLEEQIVKVNNYLQSDGKYEFLRKKLLEDKIEIISGDIFDMDKYLGDRQFDRIILSNVLQYIEYFAGKKDPYDFLVENFEVWKRHLNDDGILQFLYLYYFKKEDLTDNDHSLAIYNLKNVCEALDGNFLSIKWFDNVIDNKEDAIVMYQKGRGK